MIKYFIYINILFVDNIIRFSVMGIYRYFKGLKFLDF